MCKSLSHFGCFQELRANFVQIVQTHQSLLLERCSGVFGSIAIEYYFLDPFGLFQGSWVKKVVLKWVKNIPMNIP